MALHKIALVCDWFYPKLGGIEVQLRGLSQELRSRGYSVSVITAEPGPEVVDGVQVHRLSTPLLQRWTHMAYPRGLSDLRTVLVDGAFDLVHAHSVYSPLALGSLHLSRRLGIPSVLTNHSLLVGGEALLLSSLNFLFGWGRDADMITAVSGAVGKVTRRVAGRDDVRVIPNGIDPSLWVRRTTAAEDRLRVTTVLRLTRRKRAIDLVRAVPRVLERLPAELDPIFTIIGDGPERERVQDEVVRLGLSRRVEVVGSLSPERVQEVLARTTVFALPTVREAFSVAALEARCVGVPVVAMNHGGVGDVIKDGVHGYLTNDLQTFAERIALLLCDAGLRARMRLATTQNLDPFVWSRVIDQTIEVYRAAMVRQSHGATLGLAAHSADVQT